ncbi:hypothetical protein [Stutzerimonas stutzeri]|uniref:hypothetical protein n=1 Tax=Stutzerimonas stutzeri TaxID=316 RepID=UPI0015E484F9|nr:hypothetical protein [Stutzerimonas stutzeri]MBA1280312.1 hypothetical protein [Stutzerimonas stutzeri]
MTKLMHSNNLKVQERIEAAARDACTTLDELFPGGDPDGITSNFQGLLVEAMTHMLKGRSLLDSKRGHYVALPQLLVDESLFGNPLIHGDAFLVVKPAVVHPWDQPKPATQVLCPDSNTFRPISAIGDAWTSFEAAAKHAFEYCVREEMDLEQTKQLGLQVQAVTFSAENTGYELAGEPAGAA